MGLHDLLKVVDKIEDVEIHIIGDVDYNKDNLPKEWMCYEVTNIFTMYNPRVKESYLHVVVKDITA